MEDQITDLAWETPSISATVATTERSYKQGIIPNLQGSYWMYIYPPLLDSIKATMETSQLCPWDMIAEITDDTTPRDRKQQVLDALRNGQQTMLLTNLSADRIVFMQEIKTGRIAIRVD